MPTAYGKSKIFSERAAWDFWEKHRNNKDQSCFELFVINPTLGRL